MKLNYSDTKQRAAKLLRGFAFLLFALFAAPLFATPLFAQNEPPAGLMISARAGFDGLYKSNTWLPVTVSVANRGAPIEGEVRVYPRPTPGGDFVYRAPISLPTQSNKQVTLYVQLSTAPTYLLVELADNEGHLISSVRTNTLSRVAADELLYGVLSPDPGEFSFLENVNGSRSDASVAFLQIQDLPDVATAWNALDVLVFNDTDTAQLTAVQLQALDAWVSAGGQLVITGGANWQKTAISLSDWLPVTASGSETMADLPELVEAVGVPFRDPGPYVVTTSSLVRGELLFHEAGLPVLAARPHGRGAVYFLALDPRFAPLLDWRGVEVMFTEVASRAPSQSLWGASPAEGYAAQSAITSLPDLNLPSVWQLVGFLLLYTIIVGPANYFVLKRRARLELAWMTMPALIVLFTAVTYLTGFQLRGRDAIINQLAVAYSQADNPQARVYSLIGLYSPQRTTYDVLFPADTLARPLGNMFGRSFSSSHVNAVTYSSDTSIDGVRVDISDMVAFTAQTDRPAIDISGQGALHQSGALLRLEATIRNNSAWVLTDAALLFGDTAVAIGDFGPGQTETINQIIGGSTSSSTLPSFNTPLTSHANTLLGYSYYNDPVLYPRHQFLQAIEGEQFTPGTTSAQLPKNSAILIGWSDASQIEVGLAAGQVSHTSTTLYFVEIPLNQAVTGDASSGALSLPLFLLEWEALAESSVSDPEITYLQLSGGVAAFEYIPDAQFQQSPVTGLALQLEKDAFSSEISLPEVRLWNWQSEDWEVLTRVQWGETAVPNPTAYVGANNAVRIRLHDVDGDFYYPAITAVYPLLTVETK